MACKLKCPECLKVLREEGDEGKKGGEYRVYDSLWNSKSEAGTYRLIKCLECEYITGVNDFDA
jgi:hypothetical protein